MAHRLMRRSALLAKIEGAYGTDPTPTGATDAMYIYDLQITPLEQVEQERMPVRPFFGADSAMIGGTPVKVTFSVPIAGAGSAGGIPGYGVLLRGCGRSQVNNAGVDTIYPLVSSAFDSITLYPNRDGVLHEINGARGTVSREFNHNQVPLYKFAFTGIYVAPVDVALPALTFGATWPKPLVQNKVNTTFSMHGFTAKLQKFSFDDGVEVVWKDHVNLTEEVRITGRAAPVKGSCSVEAEGIAVKDWQALIRAGTLGVLAVTHGPALNRYKLDSSTLRLTSIAEEDADGLLLYNIGWAFYPTSAGNDEFTERVL